MSRLKNAHRHESGIAVVWVVMILVLLVGALAFSIDLARKLIIARQLQNAVDAVSLAAARNLDGTIDGWLRAKRDAIAVLRQQHLTGISSDTLKQIKFDDYTPENEDLLETESDYKSNWARYSDVEVNFDRGSYWQQDDGNYKFKSFEKNDATSFLIGGAPVEVRAHSEIPVYLISNAVEVKIKVLGLSSYFGQVIGNPEMGATSRKSIAMREMNLGQVPIAPFAIPACALFLNSDPENAWNDQNDFLAEWFNPASQCGREVLITEADPLNPVKDDTVVAGRIRHAVYPRPPTYNHPAGVEDGCYSSTAVGDLNALNCRANIPMYATLGVIKQDPHEGPTAQFQEIIGAFDGLDSQTQSPNLIGSRFRPFESDDITSNPLTWLESAVRERINSSSEQWTSLNYIPGSLDYDPSFPHLRGVEEKDRRARLGKLLYPLWQQGTTPTLNGAPLTWGDYRSPMCSDRFISPYKYKTVRVPVVVPSGDSSGQVDPDLRYCNYNQLFEPVPQDTDPVVSDTRPIVIGFVDMRIFDQGLRRLGNGGLDVNINEITSARIPADYIKPYMDLKPQLIDPLPEDYWKPYTSFIQEHMDYHDCIDLDPCEPGEAPPGCRDYSCNEPPSASGLLDQGEYENTFNQCFYMPSYTNMVGCINNPLNCLSIIIDAISQFIGCDNPIGGGEPNCWGYRRQAAHPNWSCLPYKKYGCGDSANYFCWEPPTPRAAQYGCAAIRARVDCATQKSTSLFLPGDASDIFRTVLIHDPNS